MSKVISQISKNENEWTNEDNHRIFVQEVKIGNMQSHQIWEVEIIIFKDGKCRSSTFGINRSAIICERIILGENEEEYIRFFAELSGLIECAFFMPYKEKWYKISQVNGKRKLALGLNDNDDLFMVFMTNKLREKFTSYILGKEKNQFIEKLLEAFKRGGTITITEIWLNETRYRILYRVF